MNIRIQEYINGDWVTLTLRPGEVLRHSSGGPTDEGYEWTSRAWLLRDDTVTLQTAHDARDCDGRMSSATDFECPVRLLRARWNDYAEQWQPAWEVVDTIYRDYAAEAANY